MTDTPRTRLGTALSGVDEESFKKRREDLSESIKMVEESAAHFQAKANRYKAQAEDLKKELAKLGDTQAKMHRRRLTLVPSTRDTRD